MSISLPLKLPDFLEESDGEVRVKGHRVSLYHVLAEFNKGRSPEEISLRFPTLRTSTTYKIIGFYLDHQSEIDTYLAEYRRSLEQQASRAPAGPSKAELLRRLEQIRLKAHNAAQVSH